MPKNVPKRLSALVHASAIGGVDHEDEAVDLVEVFGPDAAEAGAAAKVVDVDLKVVGKTRSLLETRLNNFVCPN